MEKHINCRLFSGFILCWILILQPMTGLCQDSTEVIKVEFRNASELLPLFQGMLSAHGKASIDTRTNSIVVTDDQQRVEKIKSLIRRLDVPPRQVRVRVRLKEEILASDRSIKGRGSISGDNYEINVGNRKKNSISVQSSGRNTRKNLGSEYFINVLSGSPAYILAGEDIIYREKWDYLLGKYTHNKGRITIQRIETGFDVKPIITGDSANIDIIPRISYRDSRGRKNIIRFTEAATTVSAPLDQWVTISGTSVNNNEVIREILECGTSNKSSSLSISLMVEK